jgi:predicted site-specific integrase-resolvase
MMMLGYARVSTNEQDTAAQVSALKSAGCEKIFRENASGGRWDRPELHRLLDQLRKGDVLVVWRLDRLSRSLRDVLMIMERIQEALQSIGEVRLLEKSLTPTRHIRGPSFLRLALIARPTRLFSSPFDFL